VRRKANDGVVCHLRDLSLHTISNPELYGVVEDSNAYSLIHFSSTASTFVVLTEQCFIFHAFWEKFANASNFKANRLKFKVTVESRILNSATLSSDE